MCLIWSIFTIRAPKDTPVSEIHQLEQKFRQNVKELNMYCHLHSTNMIFEEIYFMLKTILEIYSWFILKFMLNVHLYSATR